MQISQTSKALMIWLTGLFFASALFLFYNAFQFSFPIAFAGMYTLMAEQIAEGGFALPMQIPYYGPGGVPFAYPPLAFYVMAVFLKLDISMITYTRLMPPIFSLLALMPLYLLAKDITRSHLAAGLAVLYAAFSPLLYASHTWAAGIVRAPAFLFILWGFYFFNRMLRDGNTRDAVLSGIFGGLATLTHLYYALFFALWAVCWALVHWKKISWKLFFIVPLAATITASAWLYTVLTRYGIGVLVNTFNSHDNTSFMTMLAQPNLLQAWLAEKAQILSMPAIAFVFIILGLAYLISKKEFGIPATLLAAALILPAEGSSVIVLLGAILFGASSLIFKKSLDAGNWKRGIIAVIFALAVFQTGEYGFEQTQQMPPTLHRSAFEAAKYVQENTPTNARYLFIAGQSEAEWFPYLLRREPMVSKWGSEWLGTYYEQRMLQARVSGCADQQSVKCLQNLNLEIQPDDILITRKAEKELWDDLESYSQCKRLASIGRYLVWQAQCLKK
jgi:hypothetical protein